MPLEVQNAASLEVTVKSRLPDDSDRPFHPTLMMMELLISHGQTTDPRVLLQAVNGYILAAQQRYGIALFETVLERVGEELDSDVVAIYHASLGILYATQAENVPFLKRIPWVRKSFEYLEIALRDTDRQHPIPHWAAGLVFAQVPSFFGKRQAAIEHLTWLVERPETEPVYGFYREVRRHLGLLLSKDPHAIDGIQLLKEARAEQYQPKALLMSWFANGSQGTQMAPEPILDEIVPNKVFALYGFGFSDVYFVISEDGSELIAVDAGTQPHTLQAAHEFLLKSRPDLPKISSVFITHSHWDHIGGLQYFKNLNPDVKVWGHKDFRSVVGRVLRNHSYSYFRGADFDPNWVAGYEPTDPVASETMVEVGGTKIVLVPVIGGETEDALLVHFPQLDTVFVGDIVMPWYGEPWVNEGYVASAGDAIQAALDCNAKTILHGHHPLTVLYNRENLKGFKSLHSWLVEAVNIYVENGFSAKDIVRLNLVPSELINQPDLYMSYLAARDSVIARVADSLSGIWQEDRTGQAPEGLDQITYVEQGRLLQNYLGLNERQVAKILRRILQGGDNELALQLSVAAEQRYGATKEIISAKETAADRLRSSAQFFDPFKFTTYSEIIQRPLSPVVTPARSGEVT